MFAGYSAGDAVLIGRFEDREPEQVADPAEGDFGAEEERRRDRVTERWKGTGFGRASRRTWRARDGVGLEGLAFEGKEVERECF